MAFLVPDAACNERGTWVRVQGFQQAQLRWPHVGNADGKFL